MSKTHQRDNPSSLLPSSSTKAPCHPKRFHYLEKALLTQSQTRKNTNCHNTSRKAPNATSLHLMQFLMIFFYPCSFFWYNSKTLVYVKRPRHQSLSRTSQSNCLLCSSWWSWALCCLNLELCVGFTLLVPLRLCMDVSIVISSLRETNLSFLDMDA